MVAVVIPAAVVPTVATGTAAAVIPAVAIPIAVTEADVAAIPAVAIPATRVLRVMRQTRSAY